jgi:hypothetical protein
VEGRSPGESAHRVQEHGRDLRRMLGKAAAQEHDPVPPERGGRVRGAGRDDRGSEAFEGSRGPRRETQPEPAGPRTLRPRIGVESAAPCRRKVVLSASSGQNGDGKQLQDEAVRIAAPGEARPVRARRADVEAAFLELRRLFETRQLRQRRSFARMDQQRRRSSRPSRRDEKGGGARSAHLEDAADVVVEQPRRADHRAS